MGVLPPQECPGSIDGGMQARCVSLLPSRAPRENGALALSEPSFLKHSRLLTVTKVKCLQTDRKDGQSHKAPLMEEGSDNVPPFIIIIINI